MNLVNKFKEDLYLRWLIYFFIFLTLIKSLLTLPFQTPWIINDEVRYADMAKNIWFDHIFISTLQYAHTDPPGYSIILSIAHYFTGKNLIYHVMLIINSILTSLILFPSYFLSKKFMNDKFAFQISILIAISPSIFLYTFTLMSENLFLPLFLLSAYFVTEAFTTENKHMQFWAGFSIAFLFLTRVTGIAMIVAFFMVFVYYMWKNKEIVSSIKRKYIIIMSFLSVLIIFNRLKNASMEETNNFTPIISISVSDYAQNLFTIFSSYDSFILLAKIFIYEIDYIAVATFLILFVFSIFAVCNINKINNNDKFKILFLYTFVSTFVLVVTAVSHIFYVITISGYQNYFIHGRFIDPVIPILFILGGIGLKIYTDIENKSNLILGCIVFTVFTIIAISFPDSNYVFPNMLPVLYLQHIKIFFPIIVFFLILVFTIILYMYKKNIIIILIFISLISFVSIFFTYQDELNSSSGLENRNQIGRWLQQNQTNLSIAVMDIEDYKRPGGRIMWFLTKFWMNGELMLSNDPLNNSKNVDYIISSKLLPYESITESPMYILYNVNSSPNFSKVYDQLAKNDYFIDIGRNDMSYISNFWGSEDVFRWTKNNSRVKILYPKEAGTIRLIINAQGDRPSDNPAYVKLYINEHYVSNFTKNSSGLEYSFNVSKELLNPAYQILTIETNTWNPRYYGSDDKRDLGIVIDWIKIERD